MNIRAFREIIDAAMTAEGLRRQRLVGIGQKVWSLPADDLIRFFQPHAYRRPWGFVLSGLIGIEIPALREWIERNKPGEEGGILRSYFTGFIIANDDVLRNFMVTMDDPIPADLWAGLLRDSLERIPCSVADLLTTYRSDREKLGWLAHPHTKPAWDFLQAWIANPDPALHVPRMIPDGQIV